ncbi:apiosidase-like domain-containing protein [Rhodopirellula europaea]|jgi:hypothetical protein|uniref:apiosidase-like domain-containing protein n=1 Tax=Rhodopirellula europaea TaxID=1263866 RepID=UPI00034A7CB5|nr:DUF4038 domain-containing protein [Rhodopirellula europaea]
MTCQFRSAVVFLVFGVCLGLADHGGTDANATEVLTECQQWQEVELEFTAEQETSNPYTDVEAWVDFTHDDGTTIRRQMFWDGGQTFRVRFASPLSSGRWNWKSTGGGEGSGLDGKTGSFAATQAKVDSPTDFTQHGFWSIPKGGRNLIHADGTARLLCADTAWALPWRATVDQVKTYAKDRQAKGYNAALLMTVQPDLKTKGPRSRTEAQGFDVGFEDLPNGSLQKLNPDYFQTFDKLVDVLTSHGIAPVYQPVFHGYGWKGGGTAGNVVSAEDYARYCRYLVARYGARPAIWLVGGDGPAEKASIVEQLDAAGTEIEKWDAYQQPTGIHYSPHAKNRTHQDKAWLDFQWCQTGHGGEHIAERVADMWRNRPVKAVANGEPTYENIGRTGNGAGWWQGHEAWCNLTAGGTMGVVYGAGSLWQWRLDANEPGHANWCTAPGAGWREALEFEGSKYPGIAAKILEGLPLANMEPNWDCTYGRRGLLVPGKLFVLYLPEGGNSAILCKEVPRSYRVYDPKTGKVMAEGTLEDKETAQAKSDSSGEPRVLVFTAG